MTEAGGRQPAGPQPEGGWADAPRPPVTVVLDDADVRRLTTQAVRSNELRPLVTRLAVAAVLGVLLAVTWTPAVGVLAGAVLAALAAALFVLRRRAIEAEVPTGSDSTTGYDHDGSFVVAGSHLVVLPRGWAARVERGDGVAVIRGRARGSRPVVLLETLLTAADEAVLTTARR